VEKRTIAKFLLLPKRSEIEKQHNILGILTLKPGLFGLKELLELLSLEKQVTAHMPPTFIWHCAGDESVPVENTLLLTAAMQRKKVPYACHIFTGGAHGISMCTQEVETPNPDAQKWVELCDTWLNDRFEFTP
jgi:dipeptidyl aminopeptidase/acylaminoacyl peptidase